MRRVSIKLACRWVLVWRPMTTGDARPLDLSSPNLTLAAPPGERGCAPVRGRRSPPTSPRDADRVAAEGVTQCIEHVLNAQSVNRRTGNAGICASGFGATNQRKVHSSVAQAKAERRIPLAGAFNRARGRAALLCTIVKPAAHGSVSFCARCSRVGSFESFWMIHPMSRVRTVLQNCHDRDPFLPAIVAFA
jgi:hypothetical protein